MDGEFGIETEHAYPVATELREGLEACIKPLVHSGVFVSLATTGVALSSLLLLELPVSPFPLAVVFTATLLVYALDRVLDKESDVLSIPNRADFMDRYGRVMLVASLGLYGAIVGVAFALSVSGAPFLVAPPALIGLYTVGGVKRVFLVKNLLVGACWGAIPVGASVYHGLSLSLEVLTLAAFFTVMVTVAAAVFDIKDLAADRAADVRTLPTQWGVRRTRRIALGVTGLVAIGLVAAIGLTGLGLRYLSLLGVTAYVAAYIPFATRDRTSLFYGFVIDGEHVALAILVTGLHVVVW